MNKEKFLKDLEKKLSILNKEERIDIIDEYKDIIDEKVKHGKTEEEAVKDFGNLNDLAKEIISTYKVDPDYNKNDTIMNVEKAIGDGAKKLTEITNDIVDNVKGKEGKINLEKLFELIIKIFVLLLVFALLRIPFFILSEVGFSFFSTTQFMGANIIGGLWKFLAHVMYYIVCILLIVTLVKSYQKENIKKGNHKKEKTEAISEKKIKKESEKPTSKKASTQKGSSTEAVISTLVLFMIKIGICVMFLFPLWMVNIFLAIGIGITVYLMIKGVAIYGILILLIGSLSFGGYLSQIIFDGLFRNKKVHLYPFIISFILIVMGGLFTFDYFADFTVYNKVPTEYQTDTVRYMQDINQKTRIFQANEYKIDNTLQDNKIVLEVKYYPDKIMPEGIEVEWDCGSYYRCLEFEYEDKERSAFNLNDIFDHRMIDMLKKKEIYDYSQLDNIYITVYTNEKTKDLVLY